MGRLRCALCVLPGAGAARKAERRLQIALRSNNQIKRWFTFTLLHGLKSRSGFSVWHPEAAGLGPDLPDRPRPPVDVNPGYPQQRASDESIPAWAGWPSLWGKRSNRISTAAVRS